jgi:hypothetical protein
MEKSRKESSMKKETLRKRLEEKITKNLDILGRLDYGSNDRKQLAEETEALCRALKDLGGPTENDLENHIWRYTEKGVDWAIRIAECLIPLTVYVACFRSGLAFEQTGTFTSKMFMDSIKRLSLKL